MDVNHSTISKATPRLSLPFARAKTTRRKMINEKRLNMSQNITKALNEYGEFKTPLSFDIRFITPFTPQLNLLIAFSPILPALNNMCIIANLIVVDQFTFRSQQHMYILTHWHSDHYQGITHSWSHGPIYTSRITKQIMLTRYPQLREKVQVIPLGEWSDIVFNEEQVKVFAIDSNHMAGSIMAVILHRGKHYLHTGDMRFNRKIAQNCPQIFKPAYDGLNYQSRFEVEQLHLDNTFCDPIFQFPTRSKALKILTNLVKQHNPTRLFLCTDTIGKEEAFILLARHYQAKIAVNEKRMEYIRQMFSNYPAFFTLNAEQTWIEVIAKSEKQGRVVGEKGSIAVTLTGWTNLQDSYPDGYNSYLVPYSLHSNFREMELLVSWIRPKRLIPIVREGTGKWDSFSKKINTLNGYVFNLCNVKQRGMDFLKKQYCKQS